MRLLIIAMLLIVASMAGWFTVNREGDRTTIQINKSEIRQDTRGMIERGREILHQRDLQNQSSGAPQEQGSPFWNQPPQAASQAGYWGGETAQFGQQSPVNPGYHAPTNYPSQTHHETQWQAAPANWNYPQQPAPTPYFPSPYQR